MLRMLTAMLDVSTNGYFPRNGASLVKLYWLCQR